jgi:hypothetical protein
LRNTCPDTAKIQKVSRLYSPDKIRANKKPLRTAYNLFILVKNAADLYSGIL